MIVDNCVVICKHSAVPGTLSQVEGIQYFNLTYGSLRSKRFEALRPGKDFADVPDVTQTQKGIVVVARVAYARQRYLLYSNNQVYEMNIPDIQKLGKPLLNAVLVNSDEKGSYIRLKKGTMSDYWGRLPQNLLPKFNAALDSAKGKHTGYALVSLICKNRHDSVGIEFYKAAEAAKNASNKLAAGHPVTLAPTTCIYLNGVVPNTEVYGKSFMGTDRSRTDFGEFHIVSIITRDDPQPINPDKDTFYGVLTIGADNNEKSLYFFHDRGEAECFVEDQCQVLTLGYNSQLKPIHGAKVLLCAGTSASNFVAVFEITPKMFNTSLR